MMNKEQIINLWKSVGWHTLSDYHVHLRSFDEHIVLNALDADVINPKVFWQAADEHFGIDPVCNHCNIRDHLLTIPDSNKMNRLIPLYLGMEGQLRMSCELLYDTFSEINIAEIGCGYGAARSFYLDIINKYAPNVTYTGFDIVKRNIDVIEIEGNDGTFSIEQTRQYIDKFNLFFSSNTFQHLSRLQIESYLRSVYMMLPFEGYFVLMYVEDCDKTYHYGQAIEVTSRTELINMVEDIGFDVIGSASMKFEKSLTPFSLVLKK